MYKINDKKPLFNAGKHVLPIVSIEIKPMIRKLVSFLFLFQYEENHKNICIYKIAQNLELLDSD